MDVDVIIIGGGIVGLACALESAVRKRSTLLIEQHDSFGQETSSRNSEVIHSGIYYPAGSLKARLCVAGNRTTYEDCRRYGVWHNRCGKLIVAVTEDEVPELERLHTCGMANGVEGMQFLDRSGVKALEPAIECRRALLVPSTGIFDSHALMKAYLHEAKSLGADIAFQAAFISGKILPNGYELRVRDAGGESSVTAALVINAAGLSADRVAASFGVDIDAAGYRIRPNRGHYYAVTAARGKLISRLIYPVPYKNLLGAGIHVSIDKGGHCKLGPDTEFLDDAIPRADWYRFDDTRKDRFYAAVKRYFPALEPGDLSPDQVGVRPKLAGSETSAKDFVINEESARGLPGLVNLVGIESPGLTSAREIAREVWRRLEHHRKG